MFVNFFVRKLINNKPLVEGVFMSYSDDFGDTWTDPFMILDGYVSSSPIKRINNYLMVAVYSSLTRFGKQEVGISRSTDRGINWSLPVRIKTSIDSTFNEADLIEIDEEKLIVTMRPTNLRQGMGYSFSDDNGESWSKIHSFRHSGISPYLLRDKSNRLLSYADISGGRIRLLYDSNLQMNSIIVDEESSGYPSIVSLSNENYLVVYHFDNYFSTYSYLRGRYFKIENNKIKFTSLPFPLIVPDL